MPSLISTRWSFHWSALLWCVCRSAGWQTLWFSSTHPESIDPAVHLGESHGRPLRWLMSRINRTKRQEMRARGARGLPGQPPDVDRHVQMCVRVLHTTNIGEGGNKPDCSWSRKMSSDKQMVFKWANTICFVKSVTVVLEKRHKGEILHPWNWVTWLMVIRWVCFAIKSSRTAMGLL